MQGVVNAGFLFLHFRLCSRADIYYSNSASKLCEAFLQFFAVVVGSCFLYGLAQLLYPALDVGRFSCAFNDSRVFLRNGYALCLAQIGQFKIFKLEPQIFGNAPAVCKNCDIFEHSLAPVSESGSFYSANVQHSAEFIDNQSRQCFAFDIFGYKH